MKNQASNNPTKEKLTHYYTEPINQCRRLNKTLVNQNNYYCTIPDEDGDGFYLTRINFAIENDFLYSIYF